MFRQWEIDVLLVEPKLSFTVLGRDVLLVEKRLKPRVPLTKFLVSSSSRL